MENTAADPENLLSALGPVPPARPLLALHGFLGRGTDWQPVAHALETSARVLAPDLPGHGRALGLPPEAYAMDGAARCLADALDAEGVGQAVVAGYSMGGRLALFFALRHPERVAGLALLGASPGLATPEARAARCALDAQRAHEMEAGFPAFLERWYRMPLFASLTDAQRAALVADRLAHNRPHELARSLRGMGTGAQPWLGEQLPALRVGGLAAAGARDPKFVALAREMAEKSPLRAAVVPGAGHALLTEAPQAVAALLRPLLSP